MTPGSNATTIKVTYRFPQTDARWDITYKIYASGVIKVDNRFMAEGDQAPMIPRVGLRMQLPESFTDLTYYGRGPKENYRDRRTSQFIGEYAIPVKDMTSRMSAHRRTTIARISIGALLPIRRNVVCCSSPTAPLS